MGGGFGLKDLFTIVNLVGGVASIAFVMAGNLWWASFAIMLGYLGDVLDGPVARVTGTIGLVSDQLSKIAGQISTASSAIGSAKDDPGLEAALAPVLEAVQTSTQG